MPYITPKTISAPKPQPTKYWPAVPVMLNGGLNLVDKEWKLPDNQTSKALNLWFYQGELSKRWGQAYVNDDLGTQIFNSYRYKYDGKIVFHSGTKLYTLEDDGTTTEIFTGLTAQKGSFFRFNQKLYYINGAEYVVWDGTTAALVTPYIPTVIINRTPTGGGNVNEQYNRIGKAFRNSFNGNGTAAAYTLTDTNLDGTAITATINGVAKAEGTDFTADRITGVVTFTSAPAEGQNNVVITAYKTDVEAINSILKCKYATPFGGQNDNRVFMAGNGSGYYYWTGISSVGVDATYWPYNNYNIIGDTDEDITGFGKQYDTLCIFKAKEIYGETYAWDGTKGIFNTFPVNSQIGCDCPDSIQTINNQITWLNTYGGVYTLVGTAVQSQRNVFPISRNVNPWLMKESNLTSATSIDFNGKYWLCVNDKVYLWDYFISPYVDTGNPEQSAKALSWWYFDNISASSWVTDGADIFYAHRTKGQFVKFHTAYDNTQFFDFDVAIKAIYRYPFREMGGGIYEFNVPYGYIGVRGDTRTTFTVTYYSSDDWNGDPSTETIDIGSYAWTRFTWASFTWNVMGPKYEAVLMPGANNVRYFGAEFENNEAGKDMNLSSIVWQYKISKLVK